MIEVAYGRERREDNPDAEDLYLDHIVFYDDIYDSYWPVRVRERGVPMVVRGITLTGDIPEARVAINVALQRTRDRHKFNSDLRHADEVSDRMQEVFSQDSDPGDFTLITSASQGGLRAVFGLTYVEELVNQAQQLPRAASR